MGSSDSDNDSVWNEQLIGAVKKQGKTKVISEQDRIKEIEECLKEGADINTKDKKGNTALCIAQKRGYQIIIKFLQEKRASSDIRNPKRDTAMKLTENLGKQMITSVSKEPFTSPKSDVTNDDSPLNSSSKWPNRKRAIDAQDRNPHESLSKVRSIDDSQHESQRNAMPIEQRSNRKRTADDKFGKCAQRPRETRLSESSTNQDSYGSSGLKRSLHGTVYQLKHLMLILHRAWNLDYPFRLATEMDAAEKFDDIFLHYIDDNGDERYRFVQAKHNQDESRVIRASDLLNVKDGDFSLLKYFISWRKIKKHPNFVGSKLQSFILCTNIRLDKDDLKAKNINISEVEEPDDFMIITDRKRQRPRYKLLAEAPSDLWETLRSASDIHRLAKELAERVYHSKDIDLRTNMIKMYHVALEKEVVDVRKKKFFVKFIEKDEISEKAAEFREILFLNLKRLLPEKNRSEKDIQKVLRERSLKLSFASGQEAQKATKPEQTQSTELPEDTINDTEISCFFDEFILAVNQPNEVELGDIIRREIGIDGQFNLPDTGFVSDSFLNAMLNWFKAKQGKFLRNEDAKDFFDEMTVKLDSLKTMALNLEYSERLKELGIQFICENKDLQDFIDCPNDISNQLLEIVSPNQTLLTALQVCQSFAHAQIREKNEEFIFVRLKTLSTPEIMKLVLSVFKWSRHHNLLVVDCESISTEQHLQTVWNPLCDVMANDVQKRMIVITQTETDLGTECTFGHQLLPVKNTDYSFSNLTNESQKKLLEKKVITFQGSDSKSSFGKLLGIRDRDKITDDEIKDLSDIMASDTLVELINGNEIQIGRDKIGQDEVVSYYIERTILRHVVIEKAIFENRDIRDLFAISGLNGRVLPDELLRLQTPSMIRDCETNSFAAAGSDRYVQGKYLRIGETSKMAHRKRDFTVLDSGQEEKQFNDLCAGNEGRNVHWLKWEQEQYIWMKSVKDINHLVKYRDAGASNANDHRTGAIHFSEDQFTAHDEHMIISDIAGMGKSTMLKSLASKFKINDPDMLVLRFDLNQYTTALSEVSEESSYELTNVNAVVQFLVEKLLNGESILAQKVFARLIKRKHKVALIFDGFDEISPYYENTVIDLLKSLANYGIDKLVVATRPHTRESLEANLNSFSYEMRPFSRDDQEKFLTDFWTARFKDWDCNWKPKTKNRMKKYAAAIVKKLADSIDDQTNNFTGIPLQTKLVAEIFEKHRPGTQKNFNSCEEFIDLEVDEPEFPEKLDLIYLYNNFVETKFHVFFEKRGGNLAHVDVIAERKTRKKAFMNKHERLALDTLFYKDKVEKLLLCRQNAPELTDSDIADERDGIINRFTDSQPHFAHRTYAEFFAAKFFVQILKTRVQNKSFEEILVRDILLGGNNKTIRAFMDWLLSDEHVSVLKGEFWPLLLKPSRLGETIFHVAAAEGNGNIIGLFLNCIGANTEDKKFLINVADLRGETAVHRAVDYGHLGKIQLLIERTHFDINSKHRGGPTLLYKAAVKGRLDIVEYLISAGAGINSQGKGGMTPLHFAAVRGRLNVVEYLVDKGADINSRNKYGRMPVHFAAEKGHWDVVEYLVSKGANINSQNKDGTMLLQFAAKGGHLNVVEYLVGNGAAINSQNKDGTMLLHFAAKGGQLNVVEYLVGKGSDINSENKDGMTPLHFAAQARRLDVVEYLVGAGADINSQNKDGRMPIHFAAENGHWDVVEYFVGKGADINSQNKDGRMLLHSAAKGGQLNVVEYLVDKGAKINSQNKDGRMPIHFAAENRHWDVVEYLVSKGADINSQNKDGTMLLHFAAKGGHLNVVEYLVGKGADINFQNKDGTMLLHFTAKGGQLNVVEYLVGKGANINSQNKDGRMPVHFAAENRHWDVVKYLVDKGADINSQNKDGMAPLHFAAKEGSWYVVEYLVDKGADINFQNKDGRMPVHFAAENRHWDVVEYLVGKGADINSQTKDGTMLLHFAAEEGQLNVVEYLVGKGADINSQNKDGRMPVHFAAENRHWDVVEYLVGAGADINSQNKDGTMLLHFAAKGGQLNIVEYLIGKGADINSQNKDGTTLLHFAAESGSFDVVEYLVSNGADINSQNKDGTTLLHFAAERGLLDVVQYFVGKGADINFQNKHGTTPLHFAAEGGSLDVVEYLVGKGADINSQNTDGTTPLHLAARRGRLDEVEYLVGKGADINSQNKDGTTPLHSAAEGWRLDVVEYLVGEGADINSQNKGGMTPLHFAAKIGQLNIVKYLVGEGADINSQNKDGTTLLHFAAEGGLLDVVEYLVGAGADINSQNKDGTVLLHFAAEGGSLDVVEYLVAKGVDINSQNKDSTTPLHLAARRGQLDVFKYLVSKEADINSQNKDGMTPLHFAAERGHLDVVKYLDGQVADINS